MIPINSNPLSFDSLNMLKGFKIAHINVRSLLKKMDQIRLLLQDVKLDVFTVSESWLKSHLDTSLIDLEGYKAFRLDRHTETKKGKKGKKVKAGGGLVTYVSADHVSSCESLDELDASNEHIEAQWSYIHRPNCKNVVVCNMYRPPMGDLKKALAYLDDCLKSVNLNKVHIFVIGDLNVDYQSKRSPNFKRLSFFAQSNGLTQHIQTTTRNTNKTKSLIDLVFTNSNFIKSAGTLDHLISDHQPIFIVHKKGRDIRPKAEFIGRSYRSFDREKFKENLKSLNWEPLSDLKDPGEAWDFILNHITTVLDAMCPVRTFHIKNYRPDWMTKELIEQIKDRDYFYRKAKLSGDEDSWNIAKYLRNITNSSIRQAKREFILDELRENDRDAKKFWKVIRKVVPTGKQNVKQEIFLKDDNDTKVNREDTAHYINDYFINVGNSDSSSTVDAHLGLPKDTGDGSVSDLLDTFSKVNETEVYNVVKNINISKSSGLENVSSYIIKEAFGILLSEVTRMFNLSIESSRFPDDWKKALVVPIPKTGNLNNVKNFRPISLLPLPGKILEKLIHHQISDHLDANSFLSEEQHGFRRHHSTLHSIMQITDFINKKMDSRTPTLAAFIDFRKAFDCVQHPMLLHKLSQMNLDDSVLKWVRSYLSCRNQKVYANGVCSSALTVTQGVPQGSVLGPLFYIIYANDLSKLVKSCRIAMYADDTVLYTANKDFGKSVSDLQADLNLLSHWCDLNGIKANTDKTKIMVFGSQSVQNKLPPFTIRLGDTPLQSVLSYKYLGITLDTQLNYNLHMNRVIGSVTSKLKQFQRMRSFLNTKAALMVYKNMLLPILEYGDVFTIAASAENRRRLQTLQNKGLRCALGKGLEFSSEALHTEANLLKLKYRREQHLLNLMFDRAQTEASLRKPSKSAIKTRSQSKKLLMLKRPRTEKFKKSLAYAGPTKWNLLPEAVQHECSKDTFKVLVAKWVGDRAQGVP